MTNVKIYQPGDIVAVNDRYGETWSIGIVDKATDSHYGWTKVVVPGDQLVIHTRLTRHARKIFEFDTTASIDNIIVSHGKLKAVTGISM